MAHNADDHQQIAEQRGHDNKYHSEPLEAEQREMHDVGRLQFVLPVVARDRFDRRIVVQQHRG